MTDERRKEIALMLIENHLIKEGISGARVKRDAGNQAAELGIETKELMLFYETFIPKVIGRTFGYGRVSMTFQDPVSPK